MKKILLALSTIFLGSLNINTVFSTSLTNPSISAQGPSVQENKVFLSVPSVTQLGSDYCVAASLVSIFRFWGWTENKSQSEIFQEARQVTNTPPSENGVSANKELGEYMNNFIDKATNKKARYNFDAYRVTFGISIDDIAAFSSYVWNSLSLNTPLLMGIHPTLGLGHAVVICGYEESVDNIWYDKYIFMDPADGLTYNIMAKDIHQSFKYGIKIYGHGNLLGLKQQVRITVDPFTKELKDISANNTSVYAGEIRLNLTKHTGISDFSYFTTAFSLINLPGFSSEIKKVNDDPDIKKPLGFYTDVFPKTNIDHWNSKNEVIHIFSEVIGCETIATWVSLWILIEREQNNDLTLYLGFYGGVKVTKNSYKTNEVSPNELKGRVKISSGETLILQRNLNIS
ncbi:papain like cysteine protease AvrRpt2 [Entomoplasma freundtii]|uniref:Uncharacterized protein n=1 Tax=Entomoplasma freundtii TaxID=74700 RepID=A0A2K8NU45_9MOLU|nr:papain-like cysteine protease family protein [Entomoplasma freundtii]ATZ16153.1 hypothetical protein EFREU_v1c01260 [Entomoplasma freundtii]TDY56946.1 papain like cysteine protease AvrRpt2 [Entomoplasma freundtii]